MKDTNQIAKSVIDKATKNPAAVALGLLGASKGGKARAAGMTAKRRAEIASQAAKAMWKKKKK